MGEFRTKVDFSDNRQVKQRTRTIQDLSGATSFGVTFSALTSGPDLSTTATTASVLSIASSFSGNSGTTVYTWGDSRMTLGESALSAITPSNSATTQNTGGVFTPSVITTIDGNTVNLEYTGVSYDISVTGMTDLGGGAYSGDLLTVTLDMLEAGSLDFTGRTIWNDTSGITRTERLIVTDNPTVGYVWTCDDTEGMGSWQPSSGGTTGGTNTFVTGGTVVTNTLTLSRNDDVNINIDVSSLTGGTDTNTYTTGSTLVGNTIYYNRTDALSAYTTDVSSLTGGTTVPSPFELGGNGTAILPVSGTNVSIGIYSTIGGGTGNSACGDCNTIAGGFLNTTHCGHSTIGGGWFNTASTESAFGYGATVSGGYKNSASGYYAPTVGGGRCNSASSYYTSTISGGYCNCITRDGIDGFIGGGKSNTVSAGYGTISGGYGNQVSGDSSSIAGGNSNCIYDTSGNSFIGGGVDNCTLDDYEVIGGGRLNTNSGRYSSILGGRLNNITINGDYSAILGGSGNTANAAQVFVIGNGLSGGTSATTYVDNLNINTVSAGPGTTDLGVDANGFVVDQASDRKLKENIETIENALDTVLGLRGVTYNWRDRNKGGNAKKLGFIAQEVDGVIPELAYYNANGDYMGVHYKDITALLVEAVKELVTSGTTTSNNTHLETQTILAEDNDIELNFNGDKSTAIGGGIKVLHAKGIDEDVFFKTNQNGEWVTNNNLKPKALTIPEYIPTSSSDESGSDGMITRDNNHLYVKVSGGWKRINLENF